MFNKEFYIMKCKFCGKDIPQTEGKIFYCPYCNSILDTELMSESLPECDKNGNPVREFLPSLDGIRNYGKINDEIASICRYKISNKKKWFIAFIVFSVLTAVFTIFNLGWLISVGCGIAVLSLCAACATLKQTRDETYVIHYGAQAIIRYYQNDTNIGFAMIDSKANDYKDVPEVMFLEIEKSNIHRIEKHQKEPIYEIYLKEAVDFDEDFHECFEMPQIFTPEEVRLFTNCPVDDD